MEGIIMSSLLVEGGPNGMVYVKVYTGEWYKDVYLR